MSPFWSDHKTKYWVKFVDDSLQWYWQVTWHISTVTCQVSHVSCHVSHVTCYVSRSKSPKIGHKSAIKLHFYGYRVKMCYLFLNVLLRPQILRYLKAKSSSYYELLWIIAGLSGSPKVHCAVVLSVKKVERCSQKLITAVRRKPLWFPISAVWDLQCTDFTAAFLNFFHTTP